MAANHVANIAAQRISRTSIAFSLTNAPNDTFPILLSVQYLQVKNACFPSFLREILGLLVFFQSLTKEVAQIPLLSSRQSTFRMRAIELTEEL